MPKIKNFEPRLYQETILHTCNQNNTLVVLPTGLGKTKIGILATINRLNKYPGSKALFLTPTKPLANQIYHEFIENTDVTNISLFTGSVPPAKRKELWGKSSIVISTPQGLENDIINDSISLEEVSILVIDEAHRAVKDYSYTWVAKQYHKKAKYERIIGLTASPGSDLETISEVSKNIFTKEIETRIETDPDVKSYVQDIDIEWIKLELPEEFKELKKYLEDAMLIKLKELQSLGYNKASLNLSKKELLSIQSNLQRQIATGIKDFLTFRAVSISAELLKINHAIEMLETQGVKSLYNYLDSIFKTAESSKTKAVKNLVKDLNIKSAYIKSKLILDEGIEHPKKVELLKIVENEISKNPNIKIIIFNQYRDSAKEIEKKLNAHPQIKSKLFVGQAKKNGTGLTQKEQIKILNEFENSIYNCLISTSIGEEGLDIPHVDLVIFYEPVPSVIRSIQRRGRTARHSTGRLIVLMAKNTRDEAYHWTAFHKEKRMRRLLIQLKEKLDLSKQTTLDESIQEKTDLFVFADNREGGTQLIKKLKEIGISIKMKTLSTADFIISSRVGIERKTPKDFIDSIIDKRLLHQLKDLKENFERPLIIIEGDEDIYSQRKIHPNAIRGMLATITISYGIPIIQTKSSQETAELIKSIALREQNKEDRDIGVRTDRKPLTTKEQQEFIIESLPGVGPSLAKSLLSEFKTVKNIINSEENQLKKINQLGDKKVKEIIRILEEFYED